MRWLARAVQLGLWIRPITIPTWILWVRRRGSMGTLVSNLSRIVSWHVFRLAHSSARYFSFAIGSDLMLSLIFVAGHIIHYLPKLFLISFSSVNNVAYLFLFFSSDIIWNFLTFLSFGIDERVFFLVWVFCVHYLWVNKLLSLLL